MWIDIFHKFYQISISEYIQQIILFPLIVFSRFLPASGLVIFYFLGKKFEKINFYIRLLQTLIGIIIINFIPYWLSPHTGLRYLLPLYPFIALLIAIFLWHLPKQKMKTIIFWYSLGYTSKIFRINFFLLLSALF
jgi:hypothetical protein